MNFKALRENSEKSKSLPFFDFSSGWPSFIEWSSNSIILVLRQSVCYRYGMNTDMALQDSVLPTVLYHDAPSGLVVFDKPCNLIVQGDDERTLSNIVAKRWPLSEGQSWKYAHQLDYATSGCILFT